MKTYTYSEARQSLAGLLADARREGAVYIRRRDGQVFEVRPAPHAGSPLDVPAVSVGIEAGESSAWLRESRASSGRLVPRKRTAAKPR